MLNERMVCLIGDICTYIIHRSLHFIIAFIFIFASVDFSYNRVKVYLRLHISFTLIEKKKDMMPALEQHIKLPNCA